MRLSSSNSNQQTASTPQPADVSRTAQVFLQPLQADTGAAPNPYMSVCTLAFGLPALRQTAQPGDWVVFTTPTAELGVICAMQVTRKMTLPEYDQYCQAELPGKIPQTELNFPAAHAADCVYDFSVPAQVPVLRSGIRKLDDILPDLQGRFVLLSDFFFYFGHHPLRLPAALSAQGAGVAQPTGQLTPAAAETYAHWLKNLAFPRNTLLHKPAQPVSLTEEFRVKGCNGCGKCGAALPGTMFMSEERIAKLQEKFRREVHETQ